MKQETMNRKQPVMTLIKPSIACFLFPDSCLMQAGGMR